MKSLFESGLSSLEKRKREKNSKSLSYHEPPRHLVDVAVGRGEGQLGDGFEELALVGREDLGIEAER